MNEISLRIRRLFLLVITACGLMQFLILPGMLWNALLVLGVSILVFELLLSRHEKNSFFSKAIKTLFVILLVIEILQYGIHKLNLNGATGKGEVSILTYNVFFKNSDVNSLTSLVLEQNPDILLIQELTPHIASKFRIRLNEIYQHQKLKPLNGTHGIGIYSKYSIIENNYINNQRNLPFAQVAKFDVSGTIIEIINVHLASPALAVENPNKFIKYYVQNYGVRKRQVRKLIELTDANENEVDLQLLIGDLNTVRFEPIYQKIKSNWTVARSDKFCAYNFPNSSRVKPFLNLDCAFGRGNGTFGKKKIISSGSSDHFPVWVTIKF